MTCARSATRLTPPQRSTAVGPMSTGTPAFSGPSCTHCPSQRRRTRPATATGSPCQRSVLPPTASSDRSPRPPRQRRPRAASGIGDDHGRLLRVLRQQLGQEHRAVTGCAAADVVADVDEHHRSLREGDRLRHGLRRRRVAARSSACRSDQASVCQFVRQSPCRHRIVIGGHQQARRRLPARRRRRTRRRPSPSPPRRSAPWRRHGRRAF